MTATVYVETSALVRALTNRDAALDEVLRAAPRMVTSALTLLEAARALSRHRREGDLSAAAARDAQRRLAEFERSAVQARSAQPARNATPPNGVTAPSARTPESASA